MEILGWKAWDSDEAVWNSQDHSWDSLPDSLQFVVLYKQNNGQLYRELISGQPTSKNEDDPCWYVRHANGRIKQFVGPKSAIVEGVPKEGVWASEKLYNRICEAALRATWQ